MTTRRLSWQSTKPLDGRATQKLDKEGKLVWIGLPSGYGPNPALSGATVGSRRPVARTQMHETTDWYPRSA